MGMDHLSNIPLFVSYTLRHQAYHSLSIEFRDLKPCVIKYSDASAMLALPAITDTIAQSLQYIAAAEVSLLHVIII